MRNYRLAACASLALTLAAAVAAKAGGAIGYPALGNVRLDEGTIEVWLTCVEDMYPELEPGSWQSAFSAFSLNVPGEFRMGCSWASKRQATSHQHTTHGLAVSMGSERKAKAIKNISLGSGGPRFERGEPHLIRFTWKGPAMRLYGDGRLLGRRDQIMGFTGTLGGQTLWIGDPNRRYNPIIIHAVRVSSLARPLETLAEAKPEADEFTLLLDRFDTAAAVEDGVTDAEVVAGLTGESGGRLTGDYHFVTTPQPGLALFEKADTESN